MSATFAGLSARCTGVSGTSQYQVAASARYAQTSARVDSLKPGSFYSSAKEPMNRNLSLCILEAGISLLEAPKTFYGALQMS